MAVEVTVKGTLRSINPATKEALGEVSITSLAEIGNMVASARKAQDHWRLLSLKERLSYIKQFHHLVMARKEKLAELITAESGKPLVETLSGEMFGPLETCTWLEANAERLLRSQPVKLNPVFFLGKRAYNVFEPVGVVAVISPWNYAFSIPVCTMLAALAAGNTVVLKPSPKTPLIGQAIADLFKEAAFPEGTVNVVYGDKEEAKTLVLSDVDRVVFTGSVGGGKAIMELAAKRLHPVTLELGGKHAAIVLEDTDIERVSQAIVWCAFANAGQACASIERLYVVRPLAERLSLRIAELTRKLRLGNGLNPDTDVGPMIDAEQVARVAQQVDEARAAGAKIIAGGRARPDLGGYFFEPTVLVGVNEDMRVIKEETFGPVLPILVVEDAEEAVARANNSSVGLGASIWTQDIAKAERLARKINAGLVWINDGIYSHCCADAPWGGIKNSGIGRTHGEAAFQDFVYIKHIGVDSQGKRDWHYPYSQERQSLISQAIDFCHGSTLAKKVSVLGKLISNLLKIRRQ